MKPISLQLYTLREAAKQDLPRVLKAVADIGYRGVEPAGLHGHDPKEIARIITDLGMVVSSGHTALPTAENVAQIADTELALGNKYVISGASRDSLGSMDAVKAMAEKFGWSWYSCTLQLSPPSLVVRINPLSAAMNPLVSLIMRMASRIALILLFDP